MADNDQLLQQIRKVVREENEQLKQGLADVKQTQAAHGTILAQHTTILEAVAAGQKELQETVATKADVLTVEVKVDKLRKRIEKHTGSSTHKN
jgi:DNA-binding GntR family transcriptional regulator